MTWGAPTWGYALLAVVALMAVAALAARGHYRRLASRFRGQLLERVLPGSVRRRRGLRDAMAVAGLACLVIALAEPLYGKEVRDVQRRGVDLMLVVDLSRSMDATDVEPSRLQRAKREIYDLIGMLQEDRVGLVIYAGGAFPRMPLTRDMDALEMLVGELGTDAFEAQGSALGEGIRLGIELLDGELSPAGKAILVLSDGEVHNPDDAREAAREAADAGIRIYTVGLGVDPAPIPLPQGGMLLDGGETVLTKPDPAMLKEVAKITSGAYVQSVASASDMRTLYEREIRGTLTAADRGTTETEQWKSGFQWPLGLGLLLWLGAAWLGDGRRRWAGTAAVLLAVALPGLAHAGDRATGDELFRTGEFSEAVEVFTELTMDTPGDADLWGRLGASQYRAGDFEGAARAYETEALLRGDTPGPEFNAGNSHYLAGRLEEAARRYERVLELDPDHPGAQRNLEILRHELEQRRVAAQPQPKLQPGVMGEPGGEADDAEPGRETPDGIAGPDDGEPGADEENDGQAGEQVSDAPPEAGKGQPSGSSDQASEEGTDSNTPKQGGDDSQIREDESVSGTAEIDDAQPGEGDPSAASDTPFSGDPHDDGPVTAAQADRLLEGVEEGLPRISVPGTREGKPW